MPHNGGRAQGNVSYIEGYYGPMYINICKQHDGEARWLGFNTSDDIALLINPRGYPTAMPSGGGATLRSAQHWLYGRVGDVWVLEHNVSATVRIPGGGGENIVSAQRREYTLSAVTSGSFGDGSAMSTINVTIEITAMAAGAWNADGTYIRMYPKALEAQLANEFHPDFDRRVGALGVARWMDPVDFNNTVRNEDKCPDEKFDYGSNAVSAANWCGTPTKLLNRYTGSRFAGSPPAWIDGQLVQFYMDTVPTSYPIVQASTVVGSVTRFRIVGHPWSNGDKIVNALDVSGGSQWVALGARSSTTGLPAEWTVTVVDANNIEIPYNSTGFSLPNAAIRFFSRIEFTDGTLPVKRIVRKGPSNPYVTEFSVGTMSGFYCEALDIIFMTGDGNTHNCKQGLPVESMMRFCIRNGCHPDFAIPFIWSVARKTAFVQYVFDNKPSWMRPIFRPGNEGWNTASPFALSTGYLEAIAAKLYGSLDHNLGYAYFANELFDIVNGIFTDHTNINIMDVWTQGPQFSDASLRNNRFRGHATLNGGNPANYPINKAHAIGPATYCNLQMVITGGDLTAYSGYVAALQAYINGDRDTYFNFMKADLITGIDTVNSAFHDDWPGFVSSYNGRSAAGVNNAGSGLLCIPYEGAITGPNPVSVSAGFPGSSGISVAQVKAALNAFWRSHQFGHAMVYYLNSLAPIGYQYPSIYLVQMPMNTIENWGVQPTNDFYEADTPAMTALLNWNRGAQVWSFTTSKT